MKIIKTLRKLIRKCLPVQTKPTSNHSDNRQGNQLPRFEHSSSLPINRPQNMNGNSSASSYSYDSRAPKIKSSETLRARNVLPINENIQYLQAIDLILECYQISQPNPNLTYRITPKSHQNNQTQGQSRNKLGKKR